MPNIFVDSCVWWHWRALRANQPFRNAWLKTEAEAFGALFKCIVRPGTAPFLYNARVRDELAGSFGSEFDRFARPYCTKVPIPLTRADGAYRLDGSVLHGGRMGGSLRMLLSSDGYEHERRLRAAADGLAGGSLYQRSERSREFDIEHLESALEADASLFVTTDTKLLKRVERGAAAFPDESAVDWAARIVALPSEALRRRECAQAACAHSQVPST